MLRSFFIVSCLAIVSFVKGNTDLSWIKKTLKGFDVYYTEADKDLVNDFEVYLTNGGKTVNDYFKMPFKKKVSVYIFPERNSLDKQWQNAWHDTSFHSQCWMVASGVADRMDVLSPRLWKESACDHNAENKDEIQKIITHELAHCFHGQYNPSPDFSATVNMDWFVEGLATYVSGQLDKERISQVKKLAAQSKLPGELKLMWTGQAKYGIAGSMIKYLETSFGKEAIIELLKYANSKTALGYLKVSEADLILGWKNYINKI